MHLPEPRPGSIPALIIESFKRLVEIDVIQMSAALAFYAALSLAPLVIISLGVAGMLVERDVLQAHLVGSVEGVIGVQGSGLIRTLAEEEARTGAGLLATCFGILTLLLGATAVFGQLQAGLNAIWGARPTHRSGVWMFVRHRLASLAMVVSLGFLLLVSMLVSAVLALLSDRFALAGTLVHLLASVLVSGLLFALVFKVLPDTHVSWREAAGGALLTSVLFHAGQWLIGQYLGRASVGSAYGAAGALVVLLVWVYYSSLIVFAGAQFAHAFAGRWRAGRERAEHPVRASRRVGESKPAPRPVASHTQHLLGPLRWNAERRPATRH